MMIAPASRGLAWIHAGWRLFRKSPLTWIIAIFTYWLLMALAGLVPYLGALAATLAIPAFSVSFMVMCRELERGQRLELPLLFSGFRANLPALITLGGIYLAATLAILAITQIADGGALMNWMVFGRPPTEEVLREGRIADAAALAATLYVPVLMGFWFAPVLAAWHGMPAVKALFFSFFACLRNWRAFLLYSFGWLVLGGILPGVLLALLVVLLQVGKPALAMVQVMMFGYLAVLVPTLFASFYASYREVFADQAATAEPANPSA